MVLAGTNTRRKEESHLKKPNLWPQMPTKGNPGGGSEGPRETQGPPELGAAGFPDPDKWLTNARLERAFLFLGPFAGASGCSSLRSQTDHHHLWETGGLPVISSAHTDPAGQERKRREHHEPMLGCTGKKAASGRRGGSLPLPAALGSFGAPQYQDGSNVLEGAQCGVLIQAENGHGALPGGVRRAGAG